MDLSDCSRLLYHWAISPYDENNVSSEERQVGVTCQNCQSPLAVVTKSKCHHYRIINCIPEHLKRRWYNGQHSCLPSSWSGFDSLLMHFLSMVAKKERKNDVRSGIRTHAHRCGPEHSVSAEDLSWVWRLRPLGHPDMLTNEATYDKNNKPEFNVWEKNCSRWGSNSQPPHVFAPNTAYKYGALTDCATGAISLIFSLEKK